MCRSASRTRSRCSPGTGATDDSSRSGDDHERVMRNDDQVAVPREIVRVEAAAAEDEPLGPPEVREIHTLVVVGERELARPEGEVAAEAAVRAPRAPDEFAVQAERDVPRVVEANVELRAV